jgi:hypothetical protein
MATRRTPQEAVAQSYLNLDLTGRALPGFRERLSKLTNRKMKYEMTPAWTEDLESAE